MKVIKMAFLERSGSFGTVDKTPSKRESTKVESGVWDDRSSETYY